MPRRRGSRTATESDRVEAVALWNGGMDAEEVARKFHVQPATVVRWVAQFRRSGGSGLATRTGSGRRPRLPEPGFSAALARAEVTLGPGVVPLRRLAREIGSSTGVVLEVDHAARRIRRLRRGRDRVPPGSEGPKYGGFRGRRPMTASASRQELQEFQERIQANDLDEVRRRLDTDPGLAPATLPNGVSSLMTALYARAPAIVTELERRGVVPDVFESAVLGRTDRLGLLLAAHPDEVDHFSPDGWTALHLAAHFGATDAVRLLLDRRASTAAVSRNGVRNQPLQAGVAGGHPDVVRVLLRAGADPNHRSHGGFTAAHLAVENDDVETLELLAAAHADLSIRSDGGKSPLDLARGGGKTRSFAWLESRSASP